MPKGTLNAMMVKPADAVNCRELAAVWSFCTSAEHGRLGAVWCRSPGGQHGGHSRTSCRQYPRSPVQTTRTNSYEAANA